MKPLAKAALRGAGSLILGIIEMIAARREKRRQQTAREVLADAPTTIPAARAKAEHALRESQRRHRETGLPEVDEAVREMLAQTRREGGR